MDRRPRALTFDVFGTTVDWRSSVIREGELLTRTRKAPEIDWPRFADAWRAGYHPAMHRVRTGEIPWTALDQLHRQILDGLIEPFGLAALSEADRRHLNLAWHRLDPWPDSVAGLERLRNRFIVAALSNGNISLLVDLSKYAGLTWDCILSAELARHYKPDHEVYEMAARLLDLEPDEIMMVAAHKQDVSAARAVGFQTALIYRPRETEGGQASYYEKSAVDFLDLADQLGC